MTPDLEALKALVAKWREQAKILETGVPDFSDGLAASRTECANDLEKALERLLASQGKPEAEAVPEHLCKAWDFDKHGKCDKCGLSVQPVIQPIHAPLPSDKLMGLVRKWRKEKPVAYMHYVMEVEALLSQEPSSGEVQQAVAWLIIHNVGHGLIEKEVVIGPLTDDTYMDEGSEAIPLFASPVTDGGKK